MQPYDEAVINETYTYLATEINKMGIAYLHLSANPNIPQQTDDSIRPAFRNTIILSNGLTPETAEAALHK